MVSTRHLSPLDHTDSIPVVLLRIIQLLFPFHYSYLYTLISRQFFLGCLLHCRDHLTFLLRFQLIALNTVVKTGFEPKRRFVRLTLFNHTCGECAHQPFSLSFSLSLSHSLSLSFSFVRYSILRFVCFLLCCLSWSGPVSAVLFCSVVFTPSNCELAISPTNQTLKQPKRAEDQIEPIRTEPEIGTPHTDHTRAAHSPGRVSVSSHFPNNCLLRRFDERVALLLPPSIHQLDNSLPRLCKCHYVIVPIDRVDSTLIPTLPLI